MYNPKKVGLRVIAELVLELLNLKPRGGETAFPMAYAQPRPMDPLRRWIFGWGLRFALLP